MHRGKRSCNTKLLVSRLVKLPEKQRLRVMRVCDWGQEKISRQEIKILFLALLCLILYKSSHHSFRRCKIQKEGGAINSKVALENHFVFLVQVFFKILVFDSEMIR